MAVHGLHFGQACQTSMQTCQLKFAEACSCAVEGLPTEDGNLLRRMCPLMADIVAKVFLGGRTKFLRAADAFYERRREGPYRFIQNRPGTSIVALKSVTAAEESKDQLSRDFSGRSIFDFCNNIGTKPTCRLSQRMSVHRSGPEVTGGSSNRRV
jgi:hypothetical protein